jgi:hypothetical protein
MGFAVVHQRRKQALQRFFAVQQTPPSLIIKGFIITP